MSKLPELVDTLFIVLRKQELIFLHWYTTRPCSSTAGTRAADFTTSGRWFVLMNYTVHSVMYGYYAFRAMRFRIPRWVNVAITSGQLLRWSSVGPQLTFSLYLMATFEDSYISEVSISC